MQLPALLKLFGNIFRPKRTFLPVSGQRLRFKTCIKAAFSSVRRTTFYAIYAYAIKLLHSLKNQDTLMKQDSSLLKQLGLSLFRFTGK